MYVIDGHNLIPWVPGLSLEDIDDEEKLIAALQRFTRRRRKRIEVFFDRAAPGQAGGRLYGMLRANFVPAGKTADEAIQQFLASLGRAARNVTVVSSDHRVQTDARALHATVLSSEQFSELLVEVLSATQPPASQSRARNSGASSPGGLSGKEVEEWLNIFHLDPGQAEKPIDLTPRPKEPKPRPKASPSRARHGFTPKKKN